MEESPHGLEPVEELHRQTTGPLEFDVGDNVFLKVMPKRGVVRFSKQGKLSPRYIEPLRYSRG